MKKLLSSLLLLIAWLPLAWSQEDVTGNTANNNAVPVEAVAKSKAQDESMCHGPWYWGSFYRPKLTLGLRGGLNVADMHFSYNPIDRYTHLKRLGATAGVFAQIPIKNTPLTVRPEVSFINRGDSLHWLDVYYGMKANYVDFRVPINWNFYVGNDDFSPYIMLVPEFCLASSGRISYFAEDYFGGNTIPLTKAALRGFDMGIMLGVGIDFTVNTKATPLFFSLETGFNWGLINNLASREIIDNSANPSIIYNNFNGAELWHERRHNRGAEFAMRVAIPLDSKFLAEHRRKHILKPDSVIIVQVQIDTVVEIKRDTIKVEVPKIIRTIIKDTVSYQTKECYTISEIYNLLEQGEDIAGKRICMFNINFDFNKATIREESFKPLNEMARMMYEYPDMRIEVYGHTDSIGTAEYNQKLSERRAQAVVDYLGTKGIAPGRIKAKGYGLRYPIDTNKTEEGRFRNRRVEFEILSIGEKRKN